MIALIALAGIGLSAWWLILGRYLRGVSAIIGTLIISGNVPKVLAQFEVPGVAHGGFLVDWAPIPAWPLAFIAVVLIAADVLTRRKETNGDASTHVGHMIATQTVNQADPALVDKLVAQSNRNGVLEDENARLKEQLAAAAARAERGAQAGQPVAREAIEQIRQTGDPELLQKFLLVQRDSQEAQVRAQATDWLELNREIAAVAFVRRDLSVAEEALNKILAVAKDDFDAINRLGHIYQLRSDLRAAERQYNRLLELDTTDAWRAVALGNLGTVARIRGELDVSEKRHREALDINRKLGRLEGQANQLGNLGLIAKTRRDFDAAEKLYHEALDIDRKLGRLKGQAIALGNLGLVAQVRGDLNAAEKLHGEALDIERELGRLEGQAAQIDNLGIIACQRGDLDAAEKLLRESLKIDRKLGRLEGQANQLANLGSIAEQRGLFAEARRLWSESQDLYQRIGIPHMVKQVQGWIDQLPPADGDGGGR